MQLALTGSHRSLSVTILQPLMDICPDAKEEINHAAIIMGGLNNTWNSRVAMTFQKMWNSLEHMNHWLKKSFNMNGSSISKVKQEWEVPSLSKW